MISSIAAALGMSADGVAEGLYAARHKFSARAAAIGYAIAAVLGAVYQVVTPATFTVESITVATRSVKERPQILYVVLLSAIPSMVIGVTGLYSTFINALNQSVVFGVIAGVGIILAGVGVQYMREKPVIASTSVVAGFVLYLVTGDLVIVIIASVLVGTAAARLVPERFLPGANQGDEDGEASEDASADEDAGDSISLVKPKWRELVSRPVIIGALSVFALQTGTVVSYTNVNANIAGSEPALDGATVMSSAASFASALFGGAPLFTTPAPMAGASMPVFSTVLFMAIMAGITGLGLVTRLGAFIPLQSIAGFLVVLGIPVILPENLPTVVEEPVPGGTALAVTALSNPFYGIVAGQAVAIAINLGLDQGINGDSMSAIRVALAHLRLLI